MANANKVVLIVMDGWGHGPKTDANAIFKARTPFIDSLYANYPNAELLTSGEDVGLPAGQMGNSEVGHLNIGAGRVVYQDLVRINLAIRDGSIFREKTLVEAFAFAKANNKPVHFLGLVSDGGVHSHLEHLKALCDAAKKDEVQDVYIHAFTDGRDTDPKGGLGYLRELQEHLKHSSGKIASIVGRYYAMDRDKRWERVKEAYDLLVSGHGAPATDPLKAIESSYAAGITDEFIKPIVITRPDGQPTAIIRDGDVVICFNFRTDRCREITQALTQQDFHEQNMHRMDLHYVTMTNYDDTFRNVHVIYDKDNLAMTLGEVVANAGLKQIRIAETEKYPHVTFFFSGGREAPFEGEQRILVPSPKVATYDLQPEMSAEVVTRKLCAELEKGEASFVCLNFANCDMVGHTGVFDAVVTAVEKVDDCVRRVAETGRRNGYSFLITADHGNADYMINEDGSPNTAHTTNPVPVFLLDSHHRTLQNGRLADLAPTVLHLMGLEIPKEMTGKVLCGT
ncbi:MAG: 2,3-bisphosphoglycerate-independent phosphoglycerate mutase [Bacteroidota bacterium]